MKTLRTKYLFAFLLLFIIEIFIALYVRDKFIRPYIGDVLVILVVYFALRIVLPKKIKLLPLYTFLFAIFIELLQLVDLSKLLPFLGNRFFSILLGTVFDFKDILCYFFGFLIVLLIENKFNLFDNALYKK